ncbi:MAG TPA: helix-turn-helix domain-containing protein [Candidatus Competibacteraceae bacterium]|nr:helix-turn-helix domain-containing protein [Candidatus Competibacteraceae bacterium]HRZ07267.1 helix-turn-helix domain-containing protein [Candidatus Competibacteraceae bacterium]HSA45405.1 helix-turn-helix domain-containing protein [Candidatus Competibacteraceae bacterium]
MKKAQEVIGACLRSIRERQGLTLESLAAQASVTYQYLSSLERGQENFSIQVLERLAVALQSSLKSIVIRAFEDVERFEAPKVNPAYFCPDVPLPEGLTLAQLEAAMNQTQSIFNLINRNMLLEVKRPLRDFIQGNNFSGLVSNIFSDAMDANSSYKHNHDQRYPDLINKMADNSNGMGLEVKATISVGKGGESHNGHSGWHTVVCYEITDAGIQFIHVMFAVLNGHKDIDPDWQYLGSRENSETGSRRTETYTTVLKGTTKLRDGTVFLDPAKVNFKRWRQERYGAVPPWSIFAGHSA